LEFRAVTKGFPGVRALEEVSFAARQGSVHALLGENGAGKSTLLKILSGVYGPEGGELVLGGEVQRFAGVRDAMAAGVAVIYQELHLVGELSVAENIYLGHLPNRLGFVGRAELMERSRERLRELGQEIEPSVRVSTLSIGQRQMVEIAKALTRDAKVIAFDEPTSSLSSRETEQLFEVIGRLKSQGRVVIYVSHRLEEIFRICDAATVLRDGRHVKTLESLQGVTVHELVKLMVGREIRDVYRHVARPVAEERVLEVKGLRGPGLRGAVDLSVGRGEILGVFGLVGAGRTEMLKLLYGATRATGGRMMLEGKEVRFSSPREAVNKGVVFCSEDRKKEGVIGVGSVMENINLSARRHFSGLGFWVNEAKERENARGHVERLGIKTPTLKQLAMHLSGGNQQKMILARWLGERVKVILLDEPTRGIDVGAKSEIYAIIYELAKRGIGVVVVSGELPEVLGISDRVLVLRAGGGSGVLERSEATPERVLSLALPVGSGEAGRVA
jgi:L-arabinose transport system ATP-binding protein